MTRVLFVCLGNICRSSMAEGVLKHLAEAAGRDHEIMVDSAGTSRWHIGEPPDRNAQATILARGIDISGQRARQLTPDDFQNFDLIIAMDGQNKSDILAAAGLDQTVEIARLLDYAPDQNERDVPDPWSCGAQAFEHTADLVEQGCRGLFASLNDKS